MMSSKTFLTIPKKECLVVYLEILNNSNKKWESGKKLAEIGDFGSATSIAIFSIEELVKSILVLLDGYGFKFRNIQGIGLFFKNHQIRYILAYAMFVINIFSEEIKKYIIYFRDKPNELILEIAKIRGDRRYLEQKLKYYTFRKIIALKKEFEWFSKVDVLRQDGLYCDFDEQLKNPINISEEDYQQVFRRLEKVKEVGQIIIDSFTSHEYLYKDYIEQMKLDFRQNDIYQKISNALMKLRHSNENPFELIMKNIEKK
jgi:AbiV family abortive infection protein